MMVRQLGWAALPLPNIQRRASNSWTAVRDTFFSTKEVFESHRIVFTVGTSIASVLTAWAVQPKGLHSFPPGSPRTQLLLLFGSSMAAVPEERLDVLTAPGDKEGISKPRSEVHRDGDYHWAVHVRIYSESTGEMLLQRRADCKDSWAGQWDISSAGHISAGDSSLSSTHLTWIFRREFHEELGIKLPVDAFDLIFVFLQECVINNGTYTNNEYNDVYLVATLTPIPLEALTLPSENSESEVSAVRYIHCDEYKSCLAKESGEYVPYDVNGQYGQLFRIIEERYNDNMEFRSLTLQKQINRYAPIH